jgi:tetratricopeptide (TPR) repeat protein
MQAVSLQSYPDFDALWDYANPEDTESRFREILSQFPEEDPVFLELLTQIARAQGLQRRFEQAHQTLDQVKQRLGEAPSRPRIRYLLERGRAFNSSGDAGRARPFFEQAFEIAKKLNEAFYAVDALHMLAIVQPQESVALNRQAIELAESSGEERAQDWLGSLYNNLGWSYHELGDYDSALDIFVRGEAWQRAKGRVNETRIASWCAARTLRSLGRIEEALSKQMALKDEIESVGEKDGYVFEEIGECLLVLNRGQEARPYFFKAYELLRQDPWLVEKEPERLARLKEHGI